MGATDWLLALAELMARQPELRAGLAAGKLVVPHGIVVTHLERALGDAAELRSLELEPERTVRLRLATRGAMLPVEARVALELLALRVSADEAHLDFAIDRESTELHGVGVVSRAALGLADAILHVFGSSLLDRAVEHASRAESVSRDGDRLRLDLRPALRSAGLTGGALGELPLRLVELGGIGCGEGCLELHFSPETRARARDAAQAASAAQRAAGWLTERLTKRGG